MSETSIELSNVSFAYPHQSIFDDISLTLNHGQKVALIAPNGAGKTTLLHLIAQMLRPDQGKVFAKKKGQIIDKMRFFQSLGYSHPAGYMMHDYTVAENVAWFAKMRGITDSSYSDELLHSFSLTKLCQQKCRHLSQGERKKLSLVLALLHQPSFLFLDEPTNGLDQSSKSLLGSIVQNHPGLTLIASHDQSWCDSFADQKLTIQKRALHAM